jgi:competence protein ComEC
LQPGFWLSFVAVALLMVSHPAPSEQGAAAAQGWRPALRRAVRSGVRTQAVASVGLAPLSMVFFQQISLVGFVANLGAIPLVTMVITPLALLGIVWPSLWPLAAALVQGMTQALGWLSAWPLVTWSAGVAPVWAVACGLLGGLLLVLPLPLRLRLLGVPLLLPLLLPPAERPEEGEFEVVAADVGQGTAVLLRTRRHLLVYDTGPRYSPSADAGQRVLLPLLRGRGETQVDLLVLSHSDSDHVGGAASLLAHGKVRALSSSLPDGHALLAQDAQSPAHRRCLAGQSWQWDGVRFDMLHPLREDFFLPHKPNALSCVLRVQSQGGRSLLLTGDIEAGQETALVARLGTGLHSDVLVVPHHGSRTSSTPGFLHAVTPHTALVQAAYRSRFGHPAPDVQARYRSMGIVLARSDACGAWSWSSVDPAGSARCERKIAARYWHHRVDVEPQRLP